MDTMDFFWDVHKFYDSLDIVIMLELCEKANFNMVMAAMDMPVHLGLRFLRWSKS